MLLLLSPLQAISTSEPQSQFSDKERAWMAKHPVINFTGDPDWLPFEAFTKDGRYIGIISEVLRIFEKQTPLKFKTIPTKTWDESVSLLKNGKVDMMTVSDAWSDPEYLYTNPVLPSPIVIVMKQDQPYIESVYYLQYEDIAVVKGYRYVDKIKKKYPDYNFHEVKNIQEALEGVATGKYDAALASMALATYTIGKMQLNNIKVVGKTEFNIKVLFAVRKEMAPLVGIINKIYIDEKMAHDLLKEWTYQKYVEKTDYTLITQLVILLLIILLIATILYLLFKRKSQKHVSAEGVLTQSKQEIDNAIRYTSLLEDPVSLKSDQLSSFFDDSFSVSHPKNIRSSTLAHFVKLSLDKGLLIVIDAKGESVDGVLNMLFIKRLLAKVIDEVKAEALDTDPAKILVAIEKALQLRLEKLNGENRPGNIGFDAAVAVADLAEDKLLYAGANIPLFYTQNHEVTIVRAEKHSVGSGITDYKTHTIKIVGTTNFYLLTSGYIDQIGGKQELPIGKRRVKEILGKYELQNMDTQRNALVKAYKTYKGKYPMVGDITIVGFQITEK